MTAPAPLRVIAWLSIAMGVLMVLSSVMGLLAFAAMPSDMPNISSMPGDMKGVGTVFFVMFKYSGWMAAGQLVIAAIVIWSGIDLLRLRAWARTATEVLCWLTLVFLALYAVFWVWLWLSFPVPLDMPGLNPVALRIVPIVMMVIVMAVFVIPTVLMLRYLRGPQVRAAIAGH